ALDIMPNDPELVSQKATVYQAQGKLQEAARLLAEINWRTSNYPFNTKIDQLRLERNYDEAVRFQQTEQLRLHFSSEYEKAGYQLTLAFIQRLAGDTAGAKITAEQPRKTLEQLYRDQPGSWTIAVALSQAYAAMGEKESALKEA